MVTELIDLHIEGLAGGGNTGVSNRFHVGIMHATFARAKPLKSLIPKVRAKVLIYARHTPMALLLLSV